MWRGILLITGSSFILYYLIKYKGGEKIGKYTLSHKVNLNYVAERISEEEGKKIQVNIGQIKEILKNTLGILANEYTDDDILKLLQKNRK